jgi:plasmid stability protein
VLLGPFGPVGPVEFRLTGPNVSASLGPRMGPFGSTLGLMSRLIWAHMKQLKVGLPDYLREELERAAATSGKSLADEVRVRLEASFESEGSDPETRALAAAVDNLAKLVRLQTGHKWHKHAAANRIMRYAITGRLARLQPEGEPVFRPDELPKNRPAAPGSNDPETMGLALEAIDFHAPARTSLEQSHELFEKTKELDKDKKS